MSDQITSNIPILACVGVLCLLGSVFWADLQNSFLALWRRLKSMGRIRCGVFAIGIGCLVCAGLGLWHVVEAVPGGEETVVELPKTLPDNTTESLVETLHSDWDAYGNATWPVAEVMAEACQAAYLPPYEAEREFIDLGFETVKTMSDGSMLGYVASVSDVAVVVFRGTDDPADWLVNLDRSAINTADGPVHAGFYGAYLPLSPQVMELVGASNAKSVWITGHSLGGALAVLCANELAASKEVDVAGLMTFGQPMVARPPLTDRIVESLPSRYVHFANNRDIVTRVDPSYRHCGSLVYYIGDEVRRSAPRMLYTANPKGSETSDDENFEIEPLSEREFTELQRQLEADSNEPRYTADGKLLTKATLR